MKLKKISEEEFPLLKPVLKCNPPQIDPLFGGVELYKIFFFIVIQLPSKIFSVKYRNFLVLKKKFVQKKTKMTKKIEFEIELHP